MQCTNCKSEILATAKFCPECGYKVENQGKTCPNKDCNRTGLPLEAMFCPDCGTKLQEMDKLISHTFSMRENENLNNAENHALEALKSEKHQIINSIANYIDLICIDISIEIDKRFSDIVNNTPQWINELQLESSFRVFYPMDSAKQIIEEIYKKYHAKLEKEQTNWTNIFLNPFIQERMKVFQKELRTKLVSYYLEIDIVKMKLYGVEVNIKDPTKCERIEAAIVRLLDDAGSDLYGAQFGFGPGLFKQMAIQIGAIITMLLVAITNPKNDTLLNKLRVIDIIIDSYRDEQKIKQVVTNKICSSIQRESVGKSEEIIINIRNYLQKLNKSIIYSLNNQLSSIIE